MKESGRIRILVFTAVLAAGSFVTLWLTRPAADNEMIEIAKSRQLQPLMEIDKPARLSKTVEDENRQTVEELYPFISQKIIQDTAVSESILAKAGTILDNRMVVIYLYLMVSYSNKLALVAVLATLVNLLVSKIASNGRINYSNATMINLSKLRSTTVGGIDMIDTIKASGAENGFFNRWAAMRSLLTKTTVSYTQKNASYNAVPIFVHRLSEIVVLALGAEMIIQGYLTIGMLMAFQTFMPPTGTGDCCAPKLLSYAFSRNWKPVSMAECFYGKDSASGNRIHDDIVGFRATVHSGRLERFHCV